MSPAVISITIVAYFIILFTISYIAGRKADNEGFFVGNRKSAWYIVAFAMIGSTISGSLFVEQEANSSIRASAQGLFFMMTNGLGAIIGGYASGAVVDAFSVYADGRLVSREWMDIWLIFAAYALVIGILFALVFKYKHQQESKTN